MSTCPIDDVDSTPLDDDHHTEQSSTHLELSRQRKSCQHYCYPSKLANCCSCEDLRPVADGYECYVDGQGYTKTAARDDGYCPVCNTKNYDQWIKRVKKETERKRLEDEERERLEKERRMVAERDREHNRDKESGRVEYSDGNIYIGCLLDGAPHGSGRMDYADNEDNILCYEGDWSHGKHHGKGRKLWMDELWYEGEWQDGKMHGEGICRMNEVDTLEGRFEEDEFCG
jgi:hypothetical protein